ncbi:MAG: hypothetical protein ACRDQT_02645 [Gaiellaceae bacterium]
MPALDRWKKIEAQLDPAWDVVSLSFVPEDAKAMSRAAGVLAPLGPGRSGKELRLQVSHAGADVDRLENLLGRLDRNRVWGELTLVEARVSKPVAEAAPVLVNGERPLVEQWDDEIAKLPPGWRDLLVVLDLDSTDFLAQAALVGAPLNPARVPGEIALRFRVARGGLVGYGAADGMARRCLERMDAVGVTGRLRVVDALSETDNVATLGPVWRIAGRSV